MKVVNIRRADTTFSRQLINSIPPPSDEQSIDREEFLNKLPWILEEAISLIFADFDIEAFPKSNIAVACRVLVATIVRLNEVSEGQVCRET